LKQLKAGKKELFIVNDKFGTPTYTHDFALNVELLIQKQYWGLYNMVCGGLTSRLEVTCELLNILNIGGSIKIKEVDSLYFKKEYFAERPDSEGLVNRKLDLRGLNMMRDWRLALRNYINDYYQGYL
jgi:dTDP-4-dehydrorhamnose reductase